MKFLLPAILFVVPMLCRAWPSDRSHHDYHIVQCPESVDGFYPHPTRCDLYIQCDNVQSGWPSVQVLPCPPGLHWNPFAQHCDWPELACCNATSHATSTPPPTTTTTRTYEQNVRCPGNTDGLYPHPTRCDQYIQCVNMQFRQWAVYLKTCPQGLLYNQHVQACDWPQNVNCNPFDPISTTSTPAPTTTTDGETGWVDVQCPGPKSGRYPDPDCRFYLHCTHTGTPDARVQRFACPDGLFFNPTTTLCDHPANVPSCGDASSTSSTTRAYPTKPTPHDQTRTHATRPTRTYPTRPTRTYPTRPTRTYPTRPTRTYPTRPTRTYPTRPTRETTTTEQTTTTEKATTTPHPTRTNPTRSTKGHRTTDATTTTTGDNGQTGVTVYPPYPYQVCFPWYPVSGLYPDPSNCSVYWKCDFRVDSNFPQAAISPDQQLPHDIFPPGIPFECPRGQWFDRDLGHCNDIRDVHNCVTWSLPPDQTYEEAIEIPTIEHEASGDVDPFGGSGYLFYPPLH